MEWQVIKESLSVLIIPANEFGLICWGIFLGVTLAYVSLLARKLRFGKALKRLMDEEAFTPEKAILLKKSQIPFSALKGKERLLLTVEEEGEIRFYLPEENVEKAQSFFKGAKTPLWLALIELVALYFLLFFLHQVLPMVLPDIFKS